MKSSRSELSSSNNARTRAVRRSGDAFPDSEFYRNHNGGHRSADSVVGTGEQPYNAGKFSEISAELFELRPENL
jgi:hypothetical protein